MTHFSPNLRSPRIAALLELTAFDRYPIPHSLPGLRAASGAVAPRGGDDAAEQAVSTRIRMAWMMSNPQASNARLIMWDALDLPVEKLR